MRTPCIFRMSVFPKPLPHRTSTFQRLRRSNLAESPHGRGRYFARCCDSLELSTALSLRPDVSVPSPWVRLSRTPCMAVTPSSTMDPLSLQGALATCPPLPYGKLLQLPALLAEQLLREL